jgi:acyl-CoA synthetase (AMP-forming)/AMP-acid ligase II
MRIGAVLVPINTRLRTEDAAYVLDQSDSTALIIALGLARSTTLPWHASSCHPLPLVVLVCGMHGYRHCGA